MNLSGLTFLVSLVMAVLKIGAIGGFATASWWLIIAPFGIVFGSSILLGLLGIAVEYANKGF